MNARSNEFSVECRADGTGATMSGVLRLPAPAAYEEAFEPIKQQMRQATGPYTLDITGLTFINSSGITGLSRLVLLARTLDSEVVVIVTDAVPWQRKTFDSLSKLHPKLTIES